MDDLDEFLLLENPNELTFIESEVVNGKLLFSSNWSRKCLFNTPTFFQTVI